MVSRRRFIQSSAMLASGMACYPIAARSFLDETVSCFDLHTHPGVFFSKGSELYPGEMALKKTLAEMPGNVWGAFFSLVADARIIKVGPDGVKPFGNFSRGEAWTDYQRQLGLVKEVIDTSESLVFATTTSTHKQTKEKVSAYISIEGGDYLEGDPGRLEEMYQDGIRSIQLVHYHPNALGDLQTELPSHGGLSQAGKEVVKRMNKLGMVIDVAHASYETTKVVAATTSHPIMLSHSMLSTGSPHALEKRTLSPDHARVVAETGGVIGMWPSGLNKSLDDFVTNTLRLIDVVGTNHVGLGTDMDANFKPVLSNYLQVADWLSGLRAKGLTDSELNQVAGDNARRVLKKVLGS